METSQQELAQVLFPEAVDIKEARFTDQLDLEYEGLWLQLIQIAGETGESTASIMNSVWADDTMPQAFRDRALLCAVAPWDIKKQLGITTMRGGLLSMTKNTCKVSNCITDDELPQFTAWLHEAVDFQEQSGTKLFSDYQLKHYWIDLYLEGMIEEEELHGFLNSIDIPAASVTEDDQGYKLDPERFPLVDDLLFLDRSDGQEPWALKLLQQWFDHEQNPSTEIPDWLANVSTEQGLKLFKKILYGLSNKTATKVLMSWKEMEPIINYFGWGKFYQQGNTHDIMSLLKIIPDSSLNLKIGLLRNALEQHTAIKDKPLFLELDKVREAQAVANQANDSQLQQLIAAEERKTKLYIEDQKASREAWSREHKLKQVESPEAIARQAAKQRFSGLLAIIQQKVVD